MMSCGTSILSQYYSIGRIPAQFSRLVYHPLQRSQHIYKIVFLRYFVLSVPGGAVSVKISARLCCACLFLFTNVFLFAGDAIPNAAWHRGIGQPLDHPGGRKPELAAAGIIDDGYWQGAPVGGFGAGTFSRTYRGDFARWHIKGGIHKYQTVWSNQFAMYQKAEGGEPVAQVLTAAHPEGGQLDAWKWDYPVGAGGYYALYPKSWYDYRWDKFPANVVLEQFSPVLPDNYKESSYPVAVYRWHAENPTNRRVTVSVLLSWQNMVGQFRTFNRDLRGAIFAGDRNQAANQTMGSAGIMKGIVFDRNHIQDSVQEDWDGQLAIASLESPGVKVSYQTTFAPDRDGKEVWAPFS